MKMTCLEYYRLPWPILIIIFILIACPGLAISNTPISENDTTFIDQELEGLPQIDIDYLSLVQGVKYSLPVNDYFYGHLGEIPEFSDNLNEAFNRSYRNLPELSHHAFSLLSAGAGGYGPPVSGSWKGISIGSEADIENRLKQEGINILHPEEWKKLPFSLRKGILEFLIYLNRAITVIGKFIQPMADCLELKEVNDPDVVRKKLMTPWDYKELESWETIRAIGMADEKILSYASRITCEKLNWFFSATGISVPADFVSCTLVTGMGECLINGTDNDTINGNNFCVIELGGDDIYRGNTASPVSVSQPAGIVIDLKGDDKYLCDNAYLVSAVLGIAILMDLEGNDYYQTDKPGLSSAVYGSALLYDYSGDDVYVSRDNYSQASAIAGISLLIDVSGDDVYTGRSYSQGFGGTRGIGWFCDHQGDDRYNISDQEKNYYAPSFVQGAAKGRWAEATDGQSLAGGMGIFIDNSGSDVYAATSFAQGASYYFGLGLFSDKKGNDIYNAVSHSQGYAAHYALALFMEGEGNDTYNMESDPEKMTQLIGGGRDHSAGMFFDHYGDDNYCFGNRSVGIGDLNGIGLMADYNGCDIYSWIRNGINAGVPSLGKTIDKVDGMDLSNKLIPEKYIAKGIFYDSNGNNHANGQPCGNLH